MVKFNQDYLKGQVAELEDTMVFFTKRDLDKHLGLLGNKDYSKSGIGIQRICQARLNDTLRVYGLLVGGNE